MGVPIINSSIDPTAFYYEKLLDRVETRNIEIKLSNKIFKLFKYN